MWIAVDARERGDAIVAVAVMRGRVEAGGDAAVGEHAVRGVAPELEGEDAGDVGREGQRLQVEHQLDVLFERVGHADRGAGQLARLARAVLRFDALDAPFDLADVVEVFLQPGPIGGAQRVAQARRVLVDPVEDAAILGAALGALFRRGADAEQHVEDRARIADHRQRLRRAPTS